VLIFINAIFYQITSLMHICNGCWTKVTILLDSWERYCSLIFFIINKFILKTFLPTILIIVFLYTISCLFMFHRRFRQLSILRSF
jgi:hypothetical protein